MSYSAGIIGLGQIGMGYDRLYLGSAQVQTHARAFSLHPLFNLVGAADPDPNARAAFAEMYAAPAYETSQDLFAAAPLDVLVVASPTSTHPVMVHEALRMCRPRLVLCEKPLAYESAAARAMCDAAEAHEVALYVNFMRRADPGVREIANRIAAGAIEAPLKAVVWYSKGLLHNGSHFFDLMCFWFGPVDRVELVQPGRELPNGDAEPDFHVRFERGEALFCAAWEEHYSHYTIEILSPSGRLRYEQGGEIFWQRAVQHPSLDGYRRLDTEAQAVRSDMARYQYNVADELVRVLRGDDTTLCTAREAAIEAEWLSTVIEQRGE